MAYTTINKSTDYFNTKLYAGNSGTNNITGVGFQPDWTWIKKRNVTGSHSLFDAVRGVTKLISTNSNGAESTLSGGLTSFDSDGFTVGSDSDVNQNLLVSWNWKAGGGQGSSNTDGSINTTYTSVNTTAGFSISLYTGSGSAATIGHGLGAAPEIVIIKCTTHTENWVMYHKRLNSSGAGTYIFPNTNAAAGGSGSNTSYFNNTAPTSSVFSVGNDGGTNSSGKTYVAYCFKEKTGYSKFGSYTGNGADDGTFVYTGFKPAFILVKVTGAADNWTLWDNKRGLTNVVKPMLRAETNQVESNSGSYQVDILSNGFKWRSNDSKINGNGSNYIYMAFGQSLVGSNNVPCTAR